MRSSRIALPRFYWVSSPFVPLIAVVVLATGCADEAVPPTASARVATLDTVLTVDLSGMPTPTPSSPVAVNHDRSRIAIGLRDGNGEIMVFNGEGELVRRLGREGQGPGEFREVSLLTFAPGSDTLWVLDAENRRASAWAPGATEPSREITLRGRFFGTAWASDTTLVVQGRFEDDEPLDALGRAVHPGGVTPTLVEEGLGADGAFYQFIRPLAPSQGGGVWVGHFREPRLRHLDSSLVETDTFDFHAPALAGPPESAERWAAYIDTQPAVLGLTEDASGGLWVLLGLLSDPLPAVDDPGRALAEGEVGPEDLARTLLARYDPDRFSEGPEDEFELGPVRGGLLPGGLAYSFEPDELGEVTLILVRLGSREGA
jgi:hypothetical protein